MAHYAFLNDDNLVTEVITGRDETESFNGITNWEEYYASVRNQRCVRTSYNTLAGVHVLGGEPFRKNYAGIGYTYDEERDAFIPPQPWPSWVLDEETCQWFAPVPTPPELDDDGNFIVYVWDEETVAWVEVEDV